MPLTLTNLYCTPADVHDSLGTEGSFLRLDDHNEATGQSITVTSLALAGATVVSVAPLVSPLIKGTVLTFDGGGMAAVQQVTLGATAVVGAIALTVGALTDDLPALAAAFDSGVNVALAARLVKACRYGTSQVQLYCLGRYDDSQLVRSWSVNRWATAIATRWLCKRRGQVAPQGVEDDYQEALAEMKQVSVGQLQIEDIGTRTSGWPFITNTTVDIRYDVNKVRVEPSISEATPTQYPQWVDWNSAYTLGF